MRTPSPNKFGLDADGPKRAFSAVNLSSPVMVELGRAILGRDARIGKRGWDCGVGVVEGSAGDVTGSRVGIVELA
jgi:hypothetical protein